MAQREAKTFKIKAHLLTKLKDEPYASAPGELVNILLEMFFANKIPNAKIAFNKIFIEKGLKNGKRSSSTAVSSSGSTASSIPASLSSMSTTKLDSIDTSSSLPEV